MANTSGITPTVEDGKSTHLNVTEYGDEYLLYDPLYFYIVHSITGLFCLSGVVGNVSVIWILSFCIRRNPFTTYILNLAVADLTTLLSVPAYIVLVMSINFLNKDLFIFFSFVDCLVFFTHSTSLYLLTAISLEKCLSVLFPIWYRCHRPERSSAVVSFLLWILSGLLSGIFLFYHFQMTGYRVILNTVCTVNFLICTPLMIISSLTALITICCNSQRQQPPRLYIAILVTLLVFVIFGIPLSFSHLIMVNSDYFPAEILDVSYLFAAVNSSVNPLIYYFVGRNRKHHSRESLKVVFQRLFKEDGDPREGN